MNSRKMRWLLALALGVACWSVATRDLTVHAQDSEVLVMVANKANTAAAGMSVADARKLLLGETSNWRNGNKVVVVLSPAGSAERAAILKKICGMSEAAYTRYEMQAAFTGLTAATVHEGASDAAVKGIIKANSGAVGFLHKSQADESVQAVLEVK